jgi:hypothetical protein
MGSESEIVLIALAGASFITFWKGLEVLIGVCAGILRAREQDF